MATKSLQQQQLDFLEFEAKKQTLQAKLKSKYPNTNRMLRDEEEEKYFKEYVFKLLKISDHPKKEEIYDLADKAAGDYTYLEVYFDFMMDICHIMDLF